MKPKKKVAADVCDMLKDLAPPGPTAKEPDHLDSSFKKISIRIQIRCYAAITLLTLAVFFWGSLRLVAHSEAGTKALPAATAVKIRTASHPSFTSVALINKNTWPFGKIISPIAETVTGRLSMIALMGPPIFAVMEPPESGPNSIPERFPNQAFSPPFWGSLFSVF